MIPSETAVQKQRELHPEKVLCNGPGGCLPARGGNASPGDPPKGIHRAIRHVIRWGIVHGPQDRIAGR